MLCSYCFLLKISSLFNSAEGLRSLEKEGSSADRKLHDNRLATFVIGIADVCIINIEKFDHSHLTPILQMSAKSLIKFEQLGDDNENWSHKVHSLFCHQKMENMMDSEVHPQCAKMMQELDKLAEIACGMLDLEKYTSSTTSSK